jgi:hypothetical protein
MKKSTKKTRFIITKTQKNIKKLQFEPENIFKNNSKITFFSLKHQKIGKK